MEWGRELGSSKHTVFPPLLQFDSYLSSASPAPSPSTHLLPRKNILFQLFPDPLFLIKCTCAVPHSCRPLLCAWQWLLGPCWHIHWNGFMWYFSQRTHMVVDKNICIQKKGPNLRISRALAGVEFREPFNAQQKLSSMSETSEFRRGQPMLACDAAWGKGHWKGRKQGTWEGGL